MDIYPDCDFRRCKFHRIVTRNKIVLRWVTLPPVALLPFVIILADMFSAWQITTEVVGFYCTGVLGALALAYGVKQGDMVINNENNKPD